MLWTHARIIEPSRYRMRFDNLPVFILQQIGAIAVQHTGNPGSQRGCMMPGLDTRASRFDADQAHTVDVDIRVEDTHGVRAATNCCNDRIWLATGHFRHLGQTFLADHLLEVAYQHRIRVRTGDRADDVEGVVDVGNPVTHGFIERVLKGFGATFHRHDLGTQQFHAIDVGGLTAHVLAAHVHHALHAVAGGDGSSGNTMLARASFSDNPRLTHTLGEHGLADTVVHLVGAGVVEVFTLQV